MNLNLTYYKEDIYYNTGKEEKKIIEYIKNNKPESYEKILEEDSSDEFILALSSIRNNLIYSYEFKPDSTVLEIGAHLGEITNLLCKKSKKVISIETVKERAEAIAKRCEENENLEIMTGNLKDIQIQEKFDYITLFGVLEYAQNFFDEKNPALELIKYCKQYLKDDGKLLIATNNKFALKSYVGDVDECTNNTFDSITGYKSSKKTYKLGMKEIEKVLTDSEFKYYKFLYPLPDYKLPNIIFSDEYLPTSSKINAYFPYYRDCSSIFYSEVDAYDAIIKENPELFKFFANSYFIEASQTSFENDIKYISFNNYRKKRYRLMTKIKKDCVEKTYTNSESKIHFEEMKKHIQDVKGDGIRILDTDNNDKITSKFINGKLVSQIISDNLENREMIIDYLNKYKEQIYSLAQEYNENEKNIFNKFKLEVDKTILTRFKYLKNGYWDLIFKNCFIIDDDFTFFDQEWKEKNVPAEFILYRCIVNIEKLRDKIQEYDLYKEMGIEEYTNIFEELDKRISDEILDKKIFKLYTKEHSNPIYDNGRLEAELNAEKSKSGELEKSIQNLTNEIIQKNQIISQQSVEIENITNKLNNIYQSKIWKHVKRFIEK